jgi:hypothetical protein
MINVISINININSQGVPTISNNNSLISLGAQKPKINQKLILKALEEALDESEDQEQEQELIITKIPKIPDAIIINNFVNKIDNVVSNIRINLNKKISVLYGRVQSGKRDGIFQFAFDCLNAGRNCIIFTNNIRSDAMLMKESLKNILGKDKCSMYVSLLLEIKNLDILEKKMKTDRQIVIALFNPTNLQKIQKIANDIYKNNIRTSFIFDEGDIYKNTQSDAKRNQICDEIVKKYKTVFVTATPKSILFEISGIKCESVYKIPVPNNYVSTEDLEIEEIENNKKFSYISQLFKDLTIHTFKNDKCSNNKIKGVFINTDRTVEEHDKLASECCKKFKKSYVIVNNGSEIKLHKNGKPLRTSNSSLPNTLYDIQQEWPSDGSIEYLFLIGSAKISRCTPIRAELKQKPTDCNEMLLITNMIYLPSTDVECNMIQQVRLVGIYPELNRPVLKLFTTKDIKNKISRYNPGMDRILDNYFQNKNKKNFTNIVVEPIQTYEYVKCYPSHTVTRKDGLCYLTEESYDHYNTSTLSTPTNTETATISEISVLGACKQVLSNGSQLSSLEVYNILKDNQNFVNHIGLRNQISHCLGHNTCFQRHGTNPKRYSLIQ